MRHSIECVERKFMLAFNKRHKNRVHVIYRRMCCYPCQPIDTSNECAGSVLLDSIFMVMVHHFSATIRLNIFEYECMRNRMRDTENSSSVRDKFNWILNVRPHVDIIGKRIHNSRVCSARRTSSHVYNYRTCNARHVHVQKREQSCCSLPVGMKDGAKLDWKTGYSITHSYESYAYTC